jgi:heat shock protein HtpX
LQGEETDPYNTHPPLRDRIAAVEKLVDNAAPHDARSAITLLENLGSTEVKFVEECVPDMRPGTLQYVSWDEVPTRVTIPSWQKFVTEYAEPLQGVTTDTLPDQVPRFREIGSRIRDPKGMLLSPPQRTVRAGSLFATALALALIRAGWELQVQPAIFHIRRGDQELNPFDAVEQLMNGKLSRDAWVARCRDLGISQLALLHTNSLSDKPSESGAQTELYRANSSHDSITT